MKTTFPVGTKVKHSQAVLSTAHDYYLNCGREPMKSGAKRDYEKKLQARGTVITPDPKYISDVGVSVQWDDGTISHCLAHRIQIA